jgi:hypothetical protein
MLPITGIKYRVKLNEDNIHVWSCQWRAAVNRAVLSGVQSSTHD